MMSFLKDIDQTVSEAYSHIATTLENRMAKIGFTQVVELCNPSVYDSEDGVDDSIYNLPTTFNVTKHGFYDEYKIIKIKYEPTQNEIYAVGFGLGEGTYGELYDFPIHSLNAETIAQIADML